MKFARTYTAIGDQYAGVTFEPRTSRIVNPDGSVIFEAKDVMVPSAWSQVAVDVLAQKYFRKAGVPSATSRVAEDDVPEWLWRSIPDEAALNEDANVQTHLFEDRVMKTGRVRIGRGASVGAMSTVLYDAELGDGAALGDLSLVMKGERLAPGTDWTGSPVKPYS